MNIMTRYCCTGILSGKLNTTDRVFACSNSVIHAQDADIPVFNILGKYGINDYYQSPILSYDVMGDGSFMSLKQNEGFMGMDIVESVVPFDIDRELSYANSTYRSGKRRYSKIQ